MARPKDGTSDDAGDGSSDAFLREAARVDSASGVSDAAHVDLAAGSRLGRFIVREELGRGGMGIVYRAHDEGLGRSVALKVLPSRRESDPRRRARFLREARAAASIVHANVATVYEIGEAEASLYIAIELIDGETLRERFAARRPLAVGEVARIAKGILRGLRAAHARGIVHRDLKPENVMLDATGEPKILDFGLAKLRTAEETPREILEHQPTDAASTEEGRLLGTPAYMSPEQAKGTPVDARSDLFSLGVVLYEALSGGRPFVGETSFETLASVMRDEPAPLRGVSTAVPADLAAIVMRCLAKAPADRPASANDVLESLERMETRAASPVASRARLTVGVAGAAMLVAGALFAAVRFGESSTATSTVATASAMPLAAPSASAPASSVASSASAPFVSLPAMSVASTISSSLSASSAPAAPQAKLVKGARLLAPSAVRPAPSKTAAPDPLGDPN